MFSLDSDSKCVKYFFFFIAYYNVVVYRCKGYHCWVYICANVSVSEYIFRLALKSGGGYGKGCRHAKGHEEQSTSDAGSWTRVIKETRCCSAHLLEVSEPNVTLKRLSCLGGH